MSVVGEVGHAVHLHRGARSSGVAEEQREERPTEGGEDADRHEGVHRGGPVAQVLPRGAVGRATPPEVHTGVASVSENHCQLRNCVPGTIATTITGW